MHRSSLRWTIPTFLALQLGLLWIQGAQLHRQNHLLEGLREDIQALAESINDGQSSTAYDEDAAAVPVRFQADPERKKKVAVLGIEEEQDPAAKELQASRDSGQKAVKEAREAQSKISFEENARKVEETHKVQAATTSWQHWVFGATALVVLALVVRSWIRRRA
jgi:CHASE3 domain sensor protein